VLFQEHLQSGRMSVSVSRVVHSDIMVIPRTALSLLFHNVF